MKKHTKFISMVLAIMLVLSCFTGLSAVTVDASEAADDSVSAGAGLTVTAAANAAFDSRTEYIADGTQRITVTYFINSNDMLVNDQWKLTFDPSVLRYSTLQGLNKTDNYTTDETTGEQTYVNTTYHVTPLSSRTIVDDTKATEGEVSGLISSGGYNSMHSSSGVFIGFVTVTFEVLGSGSTNVNLDITSLRARKGYIVQNGELNTGYTTAYTTQTSIYKGKYNESYINSEEPATAPATEAPTTAEPTEAPTTAKPTEAPTTVAPTTAAPTTEEPTEEQTDPVPSAVYSVIGSNEDVFGGVWWIDYPGTEMTLDPADGLYKITFNDVEAQKMLQLKVIKDHDGDQCWPNTGGNYTFDVNSAGDLTVTFNPETGDINVIGDITIVDGIDIYSVIAAGNGEDTYLNGANWDPCDTSNAMIEIADGIWEITMEDIYAFDNYQIKFAANSVDENDNPVSNPWGINWGTDEEKLYPTGESIEAAFNGKNCIFEVEEDESVVKVQLDLRNFDYSTKKGAKFTITVTSPYDEQPTTEEPTEAPTTAKPTEAPTTVKPTEAPTTVAPTTAAPDPDAKTFKVNAVSNIFSSATKTYSYGADGAPETVSVTYYADIEGLYLENIQVRLYYDTSVLSFDPNKNGVYDEDEEEYDFSQIAPIAGNGAVVNADTPGVIKLVASKDNGFVLKKNGNLVAVIDVIFDITNLDAGSTDVNLDVPVITFLNRKTDEEFIVHSTAGGLNQEAYDYVTSLGTLETWIDHTAPGEEPTQEPTEAPTTVEPTEAPTTEAPTTVEPTTVPEDQDSFTVKAVSNIFNSATKTYTFGAEGAPDTVTVVYYADFGTLTNMRLQNIQFSIIYDGNVLSVDDEKNGVYDEDDEEYDLTQMLPVAGANGQINNKKHESTVKFAASNESGYTLKKNGNFVPIAKVVFDVADGAKGETTVEMRFGTITFLDKKTDAEYTIHSVAGGMDQEKYDYITSIGTLGTVVDHQIVVDHGKEATCTESGLTEGQHCEICGEVIVAQEVIPAKGHTVVVDAAVPADCTHTGLTQGSHCSVCNEVVVAQQVVPAKGHTEVIDAAVPADCTHTGLTQGSHCSVCGEVIVAQQVVPAKGHTAVVDAAVPADCTHTGLTQGSHCSVCGEVLVAQQVVPAKGHTVVTDAAVPADCTHTGLTQGSHCSVCGEVIVAQQVVPAKGHTVVTDAAVPADCTHTGLTQGSHCSVCGEVIVAQQVVPAKGHTVVVDAAVPADCTHTGLTQGSHCSVCGEVLVAQQVVPALGHDVEIVPGKEPTYEEDGLTEGQRCKRCGEWIVPQEVIPKLVPAILIGDVNGDGSVDVLDAIMIQKHAVDKVTLTPEQLYAADVNGDGQADVLDATLIQKYAVEKIHEFPKKA